MIVSRLSSYEKGCVAEDITESYLKRQGFNIIKKRYKTQFGEIDLIASKGALLIYVEVKAHKKESASLYAVTKRAQQRIGNAALYFISQYPEYNTYDMRFDVVVVKGGGSSIIHLDNAWQLGS